MTFLLALAQESGGGSAGGPLPFLEWGTAGLLGATVLLLVNALYRNLKLQAERDEKFLAARDADRKSAEDQARTLGVSIEKMGTTVAAGQADVARAMGSFERNVLAVNAVMVAALRLSLERKGSAAPSTDEIRKAVDQALSDAGLRK